MRLRLNALRRREGQAIIEALWAIVLIGLMSVVLLGLLNSSSKVTLRTSASTNQQAQLSEAQGFLLRRIAETANVLGGSTSSDMRVRLTNGDCYRFVHLRRTFEVRYYTFSPTGTQTCTSAGNANFNAVIDTATATATSSGLAQYRLLYGNVINNAPSGTTLPRGVTSASSTALFTYYREAPSRGADNSGLIANPVTDAQVIDVFIEKASGSNFVRPRPLQFSVPVRSSFVGTNGGNGLDGTNGLSVTAGGVMPIGAVVPIVIPRENTSDYLSTLTTAGFYPADGGDVDFDRDTAPANPFCDDGGSSYTDDPSATRCRMRTPNLVNRFILGADRTLPSTTSGSAGDTSGNAPGQFGTGGSNATRDFSHSHSVNSMSTSAPGNQTFTTSTTDTGAYTNGTTLTDNLGGGSTGVVHNLRLRDNASPNRTTAEGYFLMCSGNGGDTPLNLPTNPAPGGAVLPFRYGSGSATTNGRLVTGALIGCPDGSGSATWRWVRNNLAYPVAGATCGYGLNPSNPEPCIRVNIPNLSISGDAHDHSVTVSYPAQTVPGHNTNAALSTMDLRPRYVGLVYFVRVF